MAARQIYIYDIRNLSEAMQKRESSLKFMTHVIKCMPNGEGICKIICIFINIIIIII